MGRSIADMALSHAKRKEAERLKKAQAERDKLLQKALKCMPDFFLKLQSHIVKIIWTQETQYQLILNGS